MTTLLARQNTGSVTYIVTELLYYPENVFCQATLSYETCISWIASSVAYVMLVLAPQRCILA
jgi:hypothetical protein